MCDLEEPLGSHPSRMHNPLRRLLPVKLQRDASRGILACVGMIGVDKEPTVNQIISRAVRYSSFSCIPVAAFR